jgi:hypothetical protein
MRPPAPHISVWPVTDPTPDPIAVAIHSGDPLTGRLTTSDGSVREFSGWIGLALAIERALGSATSTTPNEGEPPC